MTSNFVKNAGLAALPITIAMSLIHNPIIVSLSLSVVAGFLTYKFIPLVAQVFIKHGRFGKDLLKPDRPVIPESMGLIAGFIYLSAMFLFIPVPFIPFFKVADLFDLGWKVKDTESGYSVNDKIDIPHFPHDSLSQYLSGLLSLFCMLFLGFVDDVIDVRWRVKIPIPFIASVPLLLVYFITHNVTSVMVPLPLRPYLGANVVDLGFLYYGYMLVLITFATHAINIVAGINGVEGGQTLIIASSLAINNLVQVWLTPFESTREAHLISLYFLLPLIGVTLGYLVHNWYPAKAFGGDTFVYFSGMTIAVAGILGRFSKTVWIFMLPQLFNFAYSCPQLFGFVENPRHRMPRYNLDTKLIEASRVSLEKTKTLGLIMIRILEVLHLVDVMRDEKTGKMLDCNNLTLINLVLVWGGSTSELNCTKRVLMFQVFCSLLGFVLRYGLPFLLY